MNHFGWDDEDDFTDRAPWRADAIEDWWMRALRWFGLARPVLPARDPVHVHGIEMSGSIRMLYPETSAFTRMLEQLKEVPRMRIAWLEDPLIPGVQERIAIELVASGNWWCDWKWVDPEVAHN